MTKKTRPEFKNVYYVVQVLPKFNVCGYTFTKEQANQMSREVRKYTGVPGRIIEFSREQLQELDLTGK